MTQALLSLGGPLNQEEINLAEMMDSPARDEDDGITGDAPAPDQASPAWMDSVASEAAQGVTGDPPAPAASTVAQEGYELDHQEKTGSLLGEKGLSAG